MPAELDRLVQAVVMAHPTCGHLAEALEIRGDQDGADSALENFLVATDRRLVVRVHRALAIQLPPPPVSLSKSIQAMGLRPLLSAAVANTAIRTLKDDAFHRLNPTMYWRNAVAVAVLCVLSATADGRFHDEAFPAGFFHDFGLLLLDQYVPAVFADSADRAEREHIAIEDAVEDTFGFSAAALSGAVLQQWGLPEWLWQACTEPATLDDAVEQPQTLATLVARARLASAIRGFPREFEQDTAADSRISRLVERPLLFLDRLGGEPWLQRRVDGLLAVSLFDQ